ncbi:autoinducer binding domain-containing protein [Paucibacter sp. APW11]|uniref:Autoinducer binding domain-containing protein n=1 Tax=Roseateles aquae TaxID=3077235 RepID=A0ABU3P973_9BURK|nr:autoinducer binding domain-containing protein [Paucibacter sp. APW11]MDT8998633.1 autoinducer binding domain-containing protein [Paucibacter sp. APW11]
MTSHWQEELLHVVDSEPDQATVFTAVAAAAHALGFEHCAYGLRLPVPVTQPRTLLLNNYPLPWQQRYQAAGYLHIDPTVAHCRRSTAPLVWDESLFLQARPLWDEAQQHGLGVGWAKSHFDANGVGGMFTLARCADPISSSELQTNRLKMVWLTHVAHMALSRHITLQAAKPLPALTEREVEVLKWTADGKTTSEIADILELSDNTVNFHIKNSISKLGTTNKTAAAVRAALLGLFN